MIEPNPTNTPEQLAFIAMFNSLAEQHRLSDERFVNGMAVLLHKAYDDGKDEERYDRGCSANAETRQSFITVYDVLGRNGWVDC